MSVSTARSMRSARTRAIGLGSDSPASPASGPASRRVTSASWFAAIWALTSVCVRARAAAASSPSSAVTLSRRSPLSNASSRCEKVRSAIIFSTVRAALTALSA